MILGLCALKKEKWAFAGAMFACAACDRLFPAGFAIGAIIPVGYKAMRAAASAKASDLPALRTRALAERKKVVDFVVGFVGVGAALVGVSAAVFGVAEWVTFFEPS